LDDDVVKLKLELELKGREHKLFVLRLARSTGGRVE
jgi:hypothetical protein